MWRGSFNFDPVHMVQNDSLLSGGGGIFFQQNALVFDVFAFKLVLVYLYIIDLLLCVRLTFVKCVLN